MSLLQDSAALDAEVNYYRDRVALLRARLYRRGIGTNDRLVELQRQLASAELRRRAARAHTPAANRHDGD